MICFDFNHYREKPIIINRSLFSYITDRKMTMISVKKELVEDLVDFKLKIITEEINRILTKWKINSIDRFLKDARKGKLSEAEDDAIDLTNLVDQRAELYQLKAQWSLKE
jgi:hypothetical protein